MITQSKWLYGDLKAEYHKKDHSITENLNTSVGIGGILTIDCRICTCTYTCNLGSARVNGITSKRTTKKLISSHICTDRSRNSPFSISLHFSASMAQSDAHPTGDQKVAGSIPAGSGDSLSWRLIMKYSAVPADSRKADVSFWRNVHRH